MKSAGKIALAAGAAAVIAGVAVTFFTRGENVSEQRLFAMDTSVSVKLWGKDDPAYGEAIERLDKLLDCHSEDSEISRLNRERKGVLSEETAEFLSQAKALCESYPACDITAGELTELWDVGGDPKVPGEEEIRAALESRDISGLEISGKQVSLRSGKIDTGCCGKGYACDVLKGMLEKDGRSCAVISFGSSALLFGEKPGGKKFSVSVRDPLDKNGVVGTLELGESFISTSGGYERFFEVDGVRYSHIFDLNTGRPAETDLLSVTVVGESGILTDMVSTAAYIGGSEELEKYLNDENIGVIAVDKDRKVYISAGLKDSFRLENKNYTLNEKS